MNLKDRLEKKLDESAIFSGLTLTGSLADAERMADEFSDIKPVPYIVPIERYIGISFQDQKHSGDDDL